jgi:hypothetical protein
MRTYPLRLRIGERPPGKPQVVHGDIKRLLQDNLGISYRPGIGHYAHSINLPTGNAEKDKTFPSVVWLAIGDTPRPSGVCNAARSYVTIDHYHIQHHAHFNNCRDARYCLDYWRIHPGNAAYSSCTGRYRDRRGTLGWFYCKVRPRSDRVASIALEQCTFRNGSAFCYLNRPRFSLTYSFHSECNNRLTVRGGYLSPLGSRTGRASPFPSKDLQGTARMPHRSAYGRCLAE